MNLEHIMLNKISWLQDNKYNRISITVIPWYSSDSGLITCWTCCILMRKKWALSICLRLTVLARTCMSYDTTPEEKIFIDQYLLVLAFVTFLEWIDNQGTTVYEECKIVKLTQKEYNSGCQGLGNGWENRRYQSKVQV